MSGGLNYGKTSHGVSEANPRELTIDELMPWNYLAVSVNTQVFTSVPDTITFKGTHARLNGGIFMDDHIKAEGPNSDEIDYWNGPQGHKWVNNNRLTDFMYQPLGDMTVERAALRPDERVLDIGCGCGTTTLKMAKLVAPGGDITALDVSTLMLAVAREKTKSAAVPIKLVNADAETYDLGPASFDVMFSQFGLMFFTNPSAALTNFHRALKPNGRIAFVCWRGPELNPWFVLPFEAVRNYMPEMEAPNPDAPASPFSFASKEKVEDMLHDAGFVDMQFDSFETTIKMGDGSLQSCVDYVAAFNGPVAAILRNADEATIPAIIETLRVAMEPYHTGKNLELAASPWIVTARRD
jgi:ubiquinone/menaquinone biosynthesis C-methylase UbiE